VARRVACVRLAKRVSGRASGAERLWLIHFVPGRVVVPSMHTPGTLHGAAARQLHINTRTEAQLPGVGVCRHVGFAVWPGHGKYAPRCSDR